MFTSLVHKALCPDIEIDPQMQRGKWQESRWGLTSYMYVASFGGRNRDAEGESINRINLGMMVGERRLVKAHTNVQKRTCRAPEREETGFVYGTSDDEECPPALNPTNPRKNPLLGPRARRNWVGQTVWWRRWNDRSLDSCRGPKKEEQVNGWWRAIAHSYWRMPDRQLNQLCTELAPQPVPTFWRSWGHYPRAIPTIFSAEHRVHPGSSQWEHAIGVLFQRRVPTRRSTLFR